MQFLTLLAVLAAPLVALAQNSSNPNPFVLDSTFAVTAGQPVTLKWTPTTGGTIQLVLRSGPSNNLNTGLVIQKGIANTGSYTWQVPSMITRGSDYALEIISDQDPNAVNYSAYFVIESTYTVATSTGATTTNSLFSSLSVPVATSALRSTTISPSVTQLTGTSTASTGTASTGTTSTPASTASGAGFQTTTTRPNGAPRATAMAGMAGMLGMVALGALAL